MNRVLNKVHPVSPASRGNSRAAALTTTSPRRLNSVAAAESPTPLQTRIHGILHREIAFIHHPDFNRRDAQQKIVQEAFEPRARSETSQVPRVTVQNAAAGYFAELNEYALLTSEQQTTLFRRMNYLKFRANALRSALTPRSADESAIDEIERLLAEARKARDQIITANLRLVVSIARKYAGQYHTFEDLLSEGHLALMRATEKFDCSRGFQFSTYATYAIRNDFFRIFKRQQQDNDRLEGGVEDLAAAGEDDPDEDTRAAEEYRRYQLLLQAMQGNLDERDRQIVMLRFGIDQQNGAQTLQAVGQHLGLSKERVRQLENRAIERLKQYVEGHQ